MLLGLGFTVLQVFIAVQIGTLRQDKEVVHQAQCQFPA